MLFALGEKIPTLFGQENRVSVIGTGTCEDVTKIGSGWNITSAKITPIDALWDFFQQNGILVTRITILTGMALSL